MFKKLTELCSRSSGGVLQGWTAAGSHGDGLIVAGSSTCVPRARRGRWRREAKALADLASVRSMRESRCGGAKGGGSIVGAGSRTQRWRDLWG